MQGARKVLLQKKEEKDWEWFNSTKWFLCSFAQ